MSDIWTIQAALEWTTTYLASKGDEHPRQSAEWLLSHATGLSRMELYLNYDRPLSLEERATFRGGIKRRAAGEPLQYITGSVGFRFITLAVEPGVLIPRPETEVLVSEVLERLPKPEAATGANVCDGSVSTDEAEESPMLLVVDIGTGSGCIAAALASERSNIRVIATDISPAAVSLARRNVDALGLGNKVQVLESDVGEAIDEDLMGQFDVVVSNPPYIPHKELSLLPREVEDFEPTLALDGGADGLEFFRRLAPWAYKALKPSGMLACELHETTLDQAQDIALEHGFTNVCTIKDLADRPRVLCAQKS